MTRLSQRVALANLPAQLLACAVVGWMATPEHSMANPVAADPRLREVVYDPHAVITVPVKRGVVTLIVLDDDEALVDVAAGLGGDCSKPEAAWCVAAQPGSRYLYVKPKSMALAANTLAVVTDRRTHALRLTVLADTDPKPPVYRLTIKAPPRNPATSRPPARDLALLAELQAVPPAPRPPAPQAVVAQRLQAGPQVLNAQYALAEGTASQDILPTLVFDDGRFTYLRLPGQRPLPAVFEVLGDGSEAWVNTRMEDDLLVVDRVARRFMLRAGTAVVGLWNEGFDLEGTATREGTTVSGVQRVLKGDPRQAADLRNGDAR
jgi:type IV secretion system protein VirB9